VKEMDGQTLVQKVYNEIKERGIEYDDFYNFDDFDDMAEKKLEDAERVNLITKINHDYMLTFDQRMLVNVWGQGYRIAPQCVQYNRGKLRHRKAERQVVLGIKETDCMEINRLTPVQSVSRTQTLSICNMTLAAMRRGQQILSAPVVPAITKNDVKEAMKEAMKEIDGIFDGKLKFK
jgi:hypothetical protein